jgi:hypothetical protein
MNGDQARLPYVRRGLTLLRCLLLLSLAVHFTNSWAISVSPSPSWSGSYTVSWTYPTGCTYTYFDYYPFVYYDCYLLQEKSGDGAWMNVSSPDHSTSFAFSGKKPPGFQYRILYTYGDYWSGGSYTVEGPVSVQVGPPPVPLWEEQEYATRQGDINGNGRIDLYVKRVAGSSWQLPLEELLLPAKSSAAA